MGAGTVPVLHGLVKLRRFPFWDGQADPVAALYHFSYIDDLSDMMGIMGHLPVDRIDGDHGFVPDMDGVLVSSTLPLHRRRGCPPRLLFFHRAGS